MELVVGIGFASVVGWAGEYGLARAFKWALAPEYIKRAIGRDDHGHRDCEL